MKRLLVALCVIAALASSAVAGDYSWRALGRGYYSRVNSLGQNDGWYYTLNRVLSYSYGCPVYSNEYVKYALISDYYPARSVTVVAPAYSANWKSDLVKANAALRDSELFVQAMRESGLSRGRVGAGYGVPDVSAYVSAGYNGVGYSRGVTTYQQGYEAPYAEQGNTIYGLSSYGTNIGQVDIEGLMQTQSRLVERMIEAGSEGNFAFSDRLDQVTRGQTEIQKIREAGLAARELLKAAQPPTKVTQEYETGTSATGGGSHVPDAPTGEDDERPLEDEGASMGPAMTLTVAQAYLDQNCAGCHSGAAPKAKLDLSNLAAWGRDQTAHYGELIAKRITSKDPSFVMPPPSSKKEPPTLEERRALAAVLLKKPSRSR